MALFKKQSNRTIALISMFVVLIYAYLTAGAFGLIPTEAAIFTPIGAGVMTMIGATVLMLETFLEGKKVNISKDTTAQINLGFAILMVVFGAIIMLGNITISPVMTGVLGVGYTITTLLLARELIWD